MIDMIKHIQCMDNIHAINLRATLFIFTFTSKT